MNSQMKYECYSHIRVASSCFGLSEVITEENSTLVHHQGCCLLTATILNQLNDEWLNNNQGSKLTFLLGSTGAPNFKKLGAPYNF